LVSVGVIALQGDFLEHLEMLRELGARAVPVRRPGDLSGLDALVIPGGESTAIGRLMEARGLSEPVREMALSGAPVLGTCAGAILMARRVRDRVVGETGQPTLRLMDIAVLRNAFGRQSSSFEAVVEVEGVGAVRAAFIRAPVISEVWGSARPIARLEHPRLGRVVVAAAQGSMVAAVFHTEVTGDPGLHRLLLDMARGRA
jgi:5'-phosphate synthase pdxT subunit